MQIHNPLLKDKGIKEQVIVVCKQATVNKQSVNDDWME